jgi:hypothetical protein
MRTDVMVVVLMVEDGSDEISTYRNKWRGKIEAYD